MNTPIRTLCTLLSLLFAANAYAQHQSLTLSSEASKVEFALPGTGHVTHGVFHVAKGDIRFDTAAPKIDGLVVVAAGSGDTGNDGRDKKMKNEVLDTPHFADVTFAPTSYQGTVALTGDSTIQVTGLFTLHGTPHEITVPMQLHIEGTQCTAKTHLVVPYVKWGLKDPSVFLLKVAKEVGVDLTLVGTLAPSN